MYQSAYFTQCTSAVFLKKLWPHRYLNWLSVSTPKEPLVHLPLTMTMTMTKTFIRQATCSNSYRDTRIVIWSVESDRSLICDCRPVANENTSDVSCELLGDSEMYVRMNNSVTCKQLPFVGFTCEDTQQWDWTRVLGWRSTSSRIIHLWTKFSVIILGTFVLVSRCDIVKNTVFIWC